MELRHLRYFKTLAEELHFGHAAQRLHISQPPLSQQIQNLESELGVKLFNRSRRQVTLTTAGNVFYRRAREILATVGRAVEEIHELESGEMDIISVGYKSAIMLMEIAPFLKQFQSEFPNVRLRFIQGSTTDQYNAVYEHKIDLGFVDAPVSDFNAENFTLKIRGVPVVKERFYMAIPIGHSLAYRKLVSLKEFSTDQFIFMDRQSVPSVHDLWIGMCQQAGFTPHIKYYTAQLPEVLAYVAAGAGVSFAPESAIRDWPNLIKFLNLKEKFYVTISVIYRSDNDNKTVQLFSELCHRSKVQINAI